MRFLLCAERVAVIKADKQLNLEPLSQGIDLALTADADHVGFLISEANQQGARH